MNVKKIDDTQYEFTTYKTVNDKDDNSVDVVDTVEDVTLEILERQKVKFQERLDLIQSKIDAIKAL